jgi:hypothetical protein
MRANSIRIFARKECAPKKSVITGSSTHVRPSRRVKRVGRPIFVDHAPPAAHPPVG